MHFCTFNSQKRVKFDICAWERPFYCVEPKYVFLPNFGSNFRKIQFKTMQLKKKSKSKE